MHGLSDPRGKIRVHKRGKAVYFREGCRLMLYLQSLDVATAQILPLLNGRPSILKLVT
jgi:hypothetical protein